VCITSAFPQAFKIVLVLRRLKAQRWKATPLTAELAIVLPELRLGADVSQYNYQIILEIEYGKGVGGPEAKILGNNL